MTPPGCRPFPRQLRVGTTLLGLDGYLLTVADPRWEPGLFLKHVEHVRIDVTATRRGREARVSTVGGPAPWDPVRFVVPDDVYEQFEELVAAARAAREHSRTSTPGTPPGPPA